jgi:hypothetical protein
MQRNVISSDIFSNSPGDATMRLAFLTADDLCDRQQPYNDLRDWHQCLAPSLLRLITDTYPTYPHIQMKGRLVVI